MFRPDDTPARLPDFRNVGVISRALLGVNLGMMFHLLLVVPDWPSWRERLLEAALWCEPMLLLTLAVLAGFSPLLARAPYRQGVTFTVLLAMLSAWLVRLLYGDLSAVLSSQLPWRYELAAGVSALGLLAYYRLWMRALSPLAREVELARGYLDIEKVRLGERLQIEWFIDRMPAKAAIPPLILQPLLENAVYHGIEPSLFPGVVQVNLFRVRDEVHIDIRNPLPKAGDDRARRIGNGMALENVRERLLLHFDAAATLTAKTVSGHYQVHIVLPYQEIVDAETITPVSGG